MTPHEPNALVRALRELAKVEAIERARNERRSKSSAEQGPRHVDPPSGAPGNKGSRG